MTPYTHPKHAAGPRGVLRTRWAWRVGAGKRKAVRLYGLRGVYNLLYLFDRTDD